MKNPIKIVGALAMICWPVAQFISSGYNYLFPLFIGFLGVLYLAYKFFCMMVFSLKKKTISKQIKQAHKALQETLKQKQNFKALRARINHKSELAHIRAQYTKPAAIYTVFLGVFVFITAIFCAKGTGLGPDSILIDTTGATAPVETSVSRIYWSIPANHEIVHKAKGQVMVLRAFHFKEGTFWESSGYLSNSFHLNYRWSPEYIEQMAARNREITARSINYRAFVEHLFDEAVDLVHAEGIGSYKTKTSLEAALDKIVRERCAQRLGVANCPISFNAHVLAIPKTGNLTQ